MRLAHLSEQEDQNINLQWLLCYLPIWTDHGLAARDLAKKKRNQRQHASLRADELNSSELLDVAILSLRYLARQSVQMPIEPRMLCLVLTQTSRGLMVDDVSFFHCCQLTEKLKSRGQRTGTIGSELTVRLLVDNCRLQNRETW